MKAPSIQIYPGDWLRDSVAGCSLAAQGLWLRMMYVAHDSGRYGYLANSDGSPIPPGSIAQRCGCTLEQYETLLAELDSVSVPSRTANGILFSRRMVRDAETRRKAAKRKAKERSHADVTEKSQRSSSSSSSSSSFNSKKNKKNKNGANAPPGLVFPDWLDQELWNQFLEYRKGKDKKMLSLQAQRIGISTLTKLRAAGHDPRAVIEQTIFKNWQGFFPVEARGVKENDSNDYDEQDGHFLSFEERLARRKREAVSAKANG